MDYLTKSVVAHHPNHIQHQWSPYENNGGTVIGISGRDFALLAADTRISTGYSINTRNGCKLKQLTNQCAIATSGMLADQIALHKMLGIRMVQYEQQHSRSMHTTSIAQLLSNTLYYKRFFPYYTFNVLGGLDVDGHGAIYNYDAVGSMQRVPMTCSGTGNEYSQPILDNQIDRNHQDSLGPWLDITAKEALTLLRDTFVSTTERDIYTGDSVDVVVFKSEGIQRFNFALKQD